MQPSSSTNCFTSQRQKLRALFDRREGEWIPLPDIQALGIAQHGARLNELRREYAPLGYQIENRMETGHDGIKRSWYRKIRCSREHGPRPGWKPRPFSEKRMAQDDCFVLKPPEPRPSKPVQVKSWEEVCAERDRKLAESQTAPDLVLTP